MQYLQKFTFSVNRVGFIGTRICIILQEKNMPFSALLTETLAKALDSSIDSSLRSKVLTILFNIFNEETERDFVALTNVRFS